MIAINKDAPEITVLREQYLLHAKAFFKIKLENKNATKAIDKSKLQKISLKSLAEPLYAKMMLEFHEHFEEIITAQPQTLKKIQKNLLRKIGYKAKDPIHSTQFTHFKNTMTGYYEDLMQVKIKLSREYISLGRWLTRSLAQSVCPFCNHNYTLTVNDIKNKIIVKPDFDHFYSKSNYPILAVSFFNLIPICSTCNKLKGNHEIFQSPYDPSHPLPKFRVYAKNKLSEKVLLGLVDYYDWIFLSILTPPVLLTSSLKKQSPTEGFC